MHSLMPMPVTRYFLLVASLVLGGCASTHHNPKDPFEPFNRGMYKFNDAVDKAVIKPVAQGYNAAMPTVGKMMVSNFFSNLDDVVVAANDLLQFKVVQAAADSGRILVNTTVGFYGLVDVASVVGLNKHHEDFGQTLGRWGVGSGPYLVLPILGPSSLRDGVGDYVDSHLGVATRVKQVDARNQLLAADLLNRRAKLLDRESVLNEAMIDRYSFIRDAYLQRRRSLVYDGSPPREKFEDEDEDAAPDKTSASDARGDIQSATDKAVPEPVAVNIEPSVSVPEAVAVKTEPLQPPGVYRVWVSQREGLP